MADDEQTAGDADIAADAARWRKLDALLRQADGNLPLDVDGLSIDVQTVYGHRSERGVRVEIGFKGARDDEVDLGAVLDAIEAPGPGLRETLPRRS